MKNRLFLQLFADGGEGGSAGQDGNAGGGNGSQRNAGNASYSFEQAEEIANARAIRAEQAALKSYFQQQGMTEEEVKLALTQFRQQKEANKPNVSNIEKQRDEALAKLDQQTRKNILSGKTVKPEFMDYVLFEAGKLVTEQLPFDKAADKFLKDNPAYVGTSTGYRVSTSAQSSGAGTTQNPNEFINSAIRRAAGKEI